MRFSIKHERKCRKLTLGIKLTIPGPYWQSLYHFATMERVMFGIYYDLVNKPL